jgi:FtsZ-interacting cell division protein ZipA
MSTVLIVVIVVAIIVVAALLVGLTRGRRMAAERREQRALARRREQAVGEHREAAQARTGAAEEAEHRARLAGAVAERERAEARLHEEQARTHELGLADEDLMSQERAGRGERVATERDEAVTEPTNGQGTATESDAPPTSADPQSPARERNGDR